jgi:hypothetical protein
MSKPMDIETDAPPPACSQPPAAIQHQRLNGAIPSGAASSAIPATSSVGAAAAAAAAAAAVVAPLVAPTTSSGASMPASTASPSTGVVTAGQPVRDVTDALRALSIAAPQHSAAPANSGRDSLTADIKANTPDANPPRPPANAGSAASSLSAVSPTPSEILDARDGRQADMTPEQRVALGIQMSEWMAEMASDNATRQLIAVQNARKLTCECPRSWLPEVLDLMIGLGILEPVNRFIAVEPPHSDDIQVGAHLRAPLSAPQVPTVAVCVCACACVRVRVRVCVCGQVRGVVVTDKYRGRRASPY